MSDTRIIRPIDMQMVREYLKENLDIRTEFQSPDSWGSGKIIVTLLLEGEKLCTDFSSIYL